MIVSRQDINDLFSIFHDFDVINIKLEKNILVITMNTPFGELWDLPEYIIILHLHGCNKVACEYSDKQGNNFTTSDCEQISLLQPDIQGHLFHPPRDYEFFCEGHKNPQIEYAQIRFDADTAELFDADLKPLTLDKIKILATMRWESIQKMWDEQKNADNQDKR